MSTIRTLYLELTSKCNLRCPYCFNFSNEGPTQLHATEHLLTVIQQARELLGVKELILSGGEVMLHPSWQLAVDYGQSLGLTVSLITNGIAVKEAMASFLLEHQVQVCVSLGGTCEEEDAPLRGRNVWRRSIRGLTRLGQSGIKVGLAYIIHRCNLGSAQRAVEIAVAHQVAWLRFSLVERLGRAEFYWDSIGLSLAQRLSFLQEYAQLERPAGLDIILESNPEVDLMASVVGSVPMVHDNPPIPNPTEVCLRYDGRVNLGRNKFWRSWDDFLQEQMRDARVEEKRDSLKSGTTQAS